MKMLYFQVLSILIILLVSLYDYERFSGYEHTLFNDISVMDIVDANFKQNNAPCVLKTNEGKDFKFAYMDEDGEVPLWYASSKNKQTCGIELSSEDIGNDISKCSPNNTTLNDKNLVDKIVFDDAYSDIKRCEITFKDQLPYEALAAYIKKQNSYIQKVKPPVNCEVTPWSDWSKCTHECGGGIQTRSRQIQKLPRYNGLPCPDLSETQECNIQACPVNCEVSAWTNISTCSKPCGGGKITKVRSITQLPEYGGEPCPALVSEDDCNVQPCPIDCKVSDWTNWTQCTKPCGGGTQSKTRSVLTQPAYGGEPCPPLQETQSCNIQGCAVDCEVSDWGEWSACDKKCGGGTQVRKRTITKQSENGGKGCPALLETKTCNTQGCPVNCEVSGWGDWGSCSKACGGGTQTRARRVTQNVAFGGNPCPPLEESQSCNTQQCPINCEVSGWSGWSGCTKNCGGGQQTRTRSITKQPQYGGQSCPSTSETQSCNTQDCGGGFGGYAFTINFSGGPTNWSWCNAWNSYCNSLNGSYSRMNIRGSNNQQGYTCTNSSIVNGVATALRNRGSYSGYDSATGLYWSVGDCGGARSFSVGKSSWVCGCDSNYTMRPCIDLNPYYSNPNWGGISTYTCSAPSQSITVEIG
jgi:hypothetical protein